MPLCIPSSSKSASRYEPTNKRTSEGGFQNGNGMMGGSAGRTKKPVSQTHLPAVNSGDVGGLMD